MKLPLVLAIGTAVAAIVAAFEPTGTVRGLLPFGHGVQPGSISSTGNGAQQPAEQSYAVAQATPPSTAPKRTVRGASSKVDETALRYFAAQGDQRRLEAEIARLRALYPDWTPPDNPLAVQQQGDPQLDAMWKLYAEGKLGELRKAIADRQQAEPNWQVPADLTEGQVALVQSLALKTFHALEGAGLARVDLFMDGSGALYVNEINTLPGFTAISMYPKLWAASGIEGKELVARLVDLAMARAARKQKLRTST